ncbi:MAG: GTP pyrophosphokinase family protein [Lachnospiraceae bacterium]|nr:GTP pyrophosphokinase family protein [Lachnospiraceae bacterium]
MKYVPNDVPEVDKWTEVNLVYESALAQMEARLKVLNSEFQMVHNYNPIEHIKSRIKTPESIVKKLKSKGIEPTIEAMVEHVNDIAGIRIICSFTSDIYRIADLITNQSDLEVISIKDYIKQPKQSGYQSYHMIITVPIYLSTRTVEVKVEIQIRTVAMDFWASLEHKIKYKFEGNAPQYIKQSLIDCAQMVSALDDEMLRLNDEIRKLTEETRTEHP